MNLGVLDFGYAGAGVVRGIVNDHAPGRTDSEQCIWLMLALEIRHGRFVDDDGSENAVTRVKSDFARSLQKRPVPA